MIMDYCIRTKNPRGIEIETWVEKGGKWCIMGLND